jgi:hypothetical protein
MRENIPPASTNHIIMGPIAGMSLSSVAGSYYSDCGASATAQLFSDSSFTGEGIVFIAKAVSC